jgi:hypothetical protein
MDHPAQQLQAFGRTTFQIQHRDDRFRASRDGFDVTYAAKASNADHFAGELALKFRHPARSFFEDYDLHGLQSHESRADVHAVDSN